MVCKDCIGQLVLQAFSTGKCFICGDNVITPHIPSYIVCTTCAIKNNLCQQCGKEMK